MENKNEVDKQKLKNLQEILKTIKKETGYDLEKFSDLNDFMFDIKLLKFNKKNNKIEVEKRQKLLDKALENEEELNEINEKIDEDSEKNVEKSDQKHEEILEKNENNSSKNNGENKQNFHRY